MKSKPITIVADILLVIISFIMFVNTGFVMRDTIILRTKLMRDIFQNTEMKPLTSLSLGRNTCPTEDHEPLISNEYPGVMGGLYNLDTGHYETGSCPEGNNCVEVPQISPSSSNVWRNNIICGARLKSSDYQIVSRSSNCTVGYKQCGIYNSFGDKFCMNNSTDCVINTIKIWDNITLSNMTDEQKEKLLKDYNILQLYDNVYLLYSNKFTNNQIPIDFKTSEDQPCTDRSRISYNKSNTRYELISSYNKYGCDGFNKGDNTTIGDKSRLEDAMDRRYHKMDNDTKAQHFTENDLFEKYSRLPSIGDWNFTRNIQAPLYLYERGYISFNYSCKVDEDYEGFVDHLEHLKLEKYVNMSVTLAHLIFLCVAISVLTLIKSVGKLFHAILSFFKIGLCFGFIIFNVILIIKMVRHSRSIRGLLSTLINNNCLDGETMYLMNKFSIKSRIDDINFYNYVQLYMTIAYSAGVVILSIRFIIKGVRRYRKQKAKSSIRTPLV